MAGFEPPPSYNDCVASDQARLISPEGNHNLVYVIIARMDYHRDGCVFVLGGLILILALL